MSYAELDTASIHLEASYVWMYFLFRSVNSFHSPPKNSANSNLFHTFLQSLIQKTGIK